MSQRPVKLVPKKIFIAFSLVLGAQFLLPPSLVFSEKSNETPGYKELPYYLRKLRDAELEEERIRLAKLIHDGVVNADLSDRKVVREMEPLIDQLVIAMDSGLDRMNLAGQVGWLQSAVDYYEREKLRPIVDVSIDHWYGTQTQSPDGKKLATFPEKILLYEDETAQTLVEMSDIHEAVLSPRGDRVAFFRRISPASEAVEIWNVKLDKKRQPKRIAILDSGFSILFGLNGKLIFIQSGFEEGASESDLYVIRARGGSPKKIGRISRLETVINQGPYKGNLVVYKHRIHHLGVGGQECPYVINLKGKEIGRIGNLACE